MDKTKVVRLKDVVIFLAILLFIFPFFKTIFLYSKGTLENDIDIIYQSISYFVENNRITLSIIVAFSIILVIIFLFKEAFFFKKVYLSSNGSSHKNDFKGSNFKEADEFDQNVNNDRQKEKAKKDQTEKEERQKEEERKERDQKEKVRQEEFTRKENQRKHKEREDAYRRERNRKEAQEKERQRKQEEQEEQERVRKEEDKKKQEEDDRRKKEADEKLRQKREQEKRDSESKKQSESKTNESKTNSLFDENIYKIIDSINKSYLFESIFKGYKEESLVADKSNHKTLYRKLSKIVHPDLMVNSKVAKDTLTTVFQKLAHLYELTHV